MACSEQPGDPARDAPPQLPAGTPLDDVQRHMWTSVLENVTKLADGRMRSGVEISTWVVET